MSIKINLDDIFQTERFSNSKQLIFIDQFDSEQHSLQLIQQRNQFQLALQNDLFDKNSIQLAPTQTTYSFELQTVFSQKDKKPGQRLYYENQMYQTRKMKQIQRIKDLQLEKQKLEATGKPKINQFSKKLLERKKYDENVKKNPKNNSMASTLQRQEQQLKKCTFKPQLIAKSSTTKPRKEKVFEHLFQDHKVKQLKKKMQTQQNQQEEVLKHKVSKQQFVSFLQRNGKFVEKIDKKHSLLCTTSLAYDLTSGQKLYKPKINKVPKYLIPFSKAGEKSSNHKSHKSFTQGCNLNPNCKNIFMKNADFYETSPFAAQKTLKTISQSNQIAEDPNQYNYNEQCLE